MWLPRRIAHQTIGIEKRPLPARVPLGATESGVFTDLVQAFSNVAR
jgi:hypothetical protein